MTAPINQYCLYQIPILSELVFPELGSPEMFCDISDSGVGIRPEAVSIQTGSTPSAHELEGKPWFFADGAHEALFRHVRIGEMTVTSGSQIKVRALPGVDEHLIRMYLLGSLMGCILHQRGIIPLHVSAVYINGWAWAFTAPGGTGKSTLAARIHRFAQCPMVSDDVAALHLQGGRPYLAGGPPLMKLSPEIAALFDGANVTPIPHPESDKVRVQLKNSFVPGFVPLAGIVVLERDDMVSTGELELESLTGVDAFMGSREAVYRYHMGLAMSSQEFMFARLIELVQHTRFYRGRLGRWDIEVGGGPEIRIADQLARLSDQIC